MLKIIKKDNWNISIIIIFVLIISFISWLLYAKEIGGSMKNAIFEQIQQGKSDNKEGILKNTNNETDIFYNIDQEINSINSAWKVYNSSFFSSIDSRITYFLSNEILCDQVIKGRDNWLFYKYIIDGQPMIDYEGKGVYSQSELYTAVENCLTTQRTLNDLGIQFALIIAPNKETIYSENMSDLYKYSRASRTDILVDELNKNGVNVVFPKQSLLDAHKNFQIYYKYDSHWNQLGAYIGVHHLLKEFGIIVPELSSRQITSKNLRGNYHYCAYDDLAHMSGLLSVFDDEKEFEVSGTQRIDWDLLEEEQDRKEQVTSFFNKNAERQEKVLLVGDSFRSAMLPELCQVFSEVYVVHRGIYSPDMIEGIEPDYFIAEYVERSSADICNMQYVKINNHYSYTVK